MDAESNERQVTVEQPAELPDLDPYTSYEDGDAFVVCEKSNPKAWIRADVSRELDE